MHLLHARIINCENMSAFNAENLFSKLLDMKNFELIINRQKLFEISAEKKPQIWMKFLNNFLTVKINLNFLNKKVTNFSKIRLWTSIITSKIQCTYIFNPLTVLYVNLTAISGQESPTTEETDAFYIGPCAWVLSNRKCPDAEIKFYLFTRSNADDRQLIHVEDCWENSNISTSFYNPKYPVKVIIHGKYIRINQILFILLRIDSRFCE